MSVTFDQIPFLRGSDSVATNATGVGSLNLRIPSSVKANDYCVVYWSASTTGSTQSVNKTWLTRKSQSTITGVGLFEIWTGFVPQSDIGTDITFSCSVTTNQWAVSATFWGGVNTTIPYGYLGASVNSSTGNTHTASVTSPIATDQFNTYATGANLTTAGTANWGELTGSYNPSATYGDFITNSGFISRSVNNDPLSLFEFQQDIRYGHIVYNKNGVPGNITNVNIKVEITLAWSTTAQGVIFRIPSVATGKDNFGAAVINTTTNNFQIFKVVSGTQTLLASEYIDWRILNEAVSSNGLLSVSCDNTGDVKATFTNSVGTANVSTTDTVFATGGALASGHVGLIDYSRYSYGNARKYANFSATSDASTSSFNTIVLGAALATSDSCIFTGKLGTPPKDAPANPVPVADISTSPASNSSGRTISSRYLTASTLADRSFTVSSNNESTSASERISIGWVGLNGADPKTINIRKIYEKQSKWRFYLGDQNLNRLYEIQNPRGRNISWALNRPGSASLNMSFDEPSASVIDPVYHTLIATRDGVVQWSGPIWSLSFDTASRTIGVSAVGFQQLLDKRLISPSHEKTMRFMRIDAGAIGSHMIAFANKTSKGPISIASVERSSERTRTYQRYQQVGSEIIALSDIENGFDIWIDPATNEMYFLAPGTINEDISNEVTFTYGLPNSNLKGARSEVNGDKIVNGMYAITSTAATSPPEQFEQSSLARYGLMEEQASLSEVTNSNIALNYIAGEFVYRSRPLPIWSLELKSTGNVPRALDDYHVGSVISFSIKDGPLNISNQKAKIFTLSLAIDENGNENSQISITQGS